MAAVVGIAGVVVAYNPDALDDIIHLSMLLAREEEKKAA
jgi:cadmium resistance protein CadD (predicted permease)